MRSSTSETRIADTMDNHKFNNKFFITIRKHQVKDYVDVQNLMDILSLLLNKLPTLQVGSNSFEVDKKYKQLHFHAIVYTNEYFRYKTVSSIGGFRIFWRQIYNMTKLNKYILKDNDNKQYIQDIIIQDNYYQHIMAPNRFIN